MISRLQPLKYHALMLFLAMIRVVFVVLLSAVAISVAWLLFNEFEPWLKHGIWGPEVRWYAVVGHPRSSWVKIQELINFIWDLPAWNVLVLIGFALWGVVTLLDGVGDMFESELKRHKSRAETKSARPFTALIEEMAAKQPRRPASERPKNSS